MKVNLVESEIELIRKTVVLLLKKFNATVYAFGSRVKGTNSKFSDLDLLIRVPGDHELLRGVLGQINEDLINSNFPYKVDILLNVI